MYRAILEQANKCASSGKWKAATAGLGTGAAWNSNATASTSTEEVVDGMVGMSLGGGGNRNGEGSENNAGTVQPRGKKQG